MKITLFLLLATAVVGRAQTTTELLPVGTEAPDFQITNDKTGKKIFRLSDWKTKTDADGKVVPGVWTVLDFWASWCPDCIKDIPNMKRMYEKYKNRGIVFLGVSFDENKENWTAMLKKQGIKYTQVSELKKWKTTEVSKAYKVNWIPTLYLIDKEGKVVLGTVMSEKIEKALGQLSPAE